jgi:hypothetical protein
LDDEEIGELNAEWNWLAIEFEDNDNAKIIHYTLGTPCFKDYQLSSMSSYWHTFFKKTLQGIDE